MKRLHFLPMLALLSVTACSTVEGSLGLAPVVTPTTATGTPTVAVPSSGIEQATLLLTVAEDGATVYKNLPACPSKANILGCSNPATVLKIQAADNVANAALNTAKALGTPAALSAALTDIAVVGAAVPAFSASKPTT